MTAKHTPGPWYKTRQFVVGPRDYEDSQANGMIIGVADVYGDNRNADANLIAAAPDLLKALRDVMDCAMGSVAPKSAWDAARAAIAKAEGR